MIEQSIGNIELLKNHKTAFLCSRQIPAEIVLKCYDWAIEQREAGNCIISGFHSQIEKDVLHYLLKGKQPIIVVLARGLKKKVEPEFVEPLSDGRLLIVSPFNEDIKRITNENAYKRNKMMIDLADNVFVAYASPKGNLSQLIADKSINKKIIHLTEH